MSRMEKHKARREGLANSNSTSKEDLDFNPISKINQEIELPRRTRVDNNIKAERAIVVDTPVPTSQDDVFDIDTAFKRLQSKTKRDVAYDTQLAIINDIFSDNMIEYNSTQKLYLDSITDKIMISEDELLKLLDDRENSLNKKSKRIDDRKPMKKVSNIFGEQKSNYKDIKSLKPEEIIIAKEEIIDLNNVVLKNPIKVASDGIIDEGELKIIDQPIVKMEEPTNVIQEELEEKVHLFIDDDDEKYDFSNMNSKKGSVITVFIIIILIAVLGFLVYKYIL